MINDLEGVIALDFSNCPGSSWVPVGARRNCVSVVAHPEWDAALDPLTGWLSLESLDLSGCTGIREIGPRGLFGCERLAILTPPPKLAALGSEALAWCGLTHFEAPASRLVLGDCCFQGCTRLLLVRMGEATFGRCPFCACHELKRVEVGSLLAASKKSFRGGFDRRLHCMHLPARDGGRIVGRANLKAQTELCAPAAPRALTISSYNCGNPEPPQWMPGLIRLSRTARLGLRSVDLSGVDVLPRMAFANCRALSVVALSPDLTILPSGSLQNCERLESVNLGECIRLQSLGRDCFDGCFSLRSLDFPPDLKRLGMTGVGIGVADLRRTTVVWVRFERCPHLA